MTRTVQLALNIVQSQVAWFACVLSAAAGMPWVGAAVALALIAVHVAGSPHAARESALVLAAGIFGVVADSTLLQLGLLKFASGILLPGISPPWMMALWMSFATVLNHSLRWLKPRPLVAAVLGGVAGPAAYYAGVKLGALEMPHLPAALSAIAFVWALAMPLLLWIANRLDGAQAKTMQTSLLGVLLALGMAGGTEGSAAATESTQEWRFKVSLDGKPIGMHDFKLTTRGTEQRISSAAHFKVKILRIPFYEYQHRNQEVWRNGCLTSIAANTDDNGEQLQVRGSSTGAAFKIDSPPGAAQLPACVKTFAYWDLSFLRESRLLNSQTGKYEAIAAVDRGEETIKVRGQPTVATRHTVNASGYVIDVWYTPAGVWLALQSRTPQGRTLQYELD